MGVISVEQTDRLFWLGRYTERVYTTISLFSARVDRMIDGEPGGYVDFCRHLEIPDIYTSDEDFQKRYAFDTENPDSMGRYRYETAYTKPGDALRKFYRSFDFAPEMSNLDKSIKMMEKLSEVFSYQQGVTNFATTAEEAFSIGKGVCQDYAHILITLCHMAGIPARYVVGMLIGEGASHAWVEVFQDRHWFALDPTNMLLVNEDHIKISSGRDYNDCVINQGIMVGNAQQSQEVEVLVEEIGKRDIGGNTGGRKA